MTPSKLTPICYSRPPGGANVAFLGPIGRDGSGMQAAILRHIQGALSRIVFSAESFSLMDFCLIFVPFGQYDEPEILRYAITSMCPKGADVRQLRTLYDGDRRQ